MSLYTVADGLLGTHVTWEDVLEEMQKALDTTATFGDDKTATNISDMKVFDSLCTYNIRRSHFRDSCPK